jgi:hypothetical protein
MGVLSISDGDDNIIKPVWRQLGLWAPSSGVWTSILNYDIDDNDDDNKPIWPTWAVGGLCRGVRHQY